MANATDINEEESNLVTIYPNPSKGIIQINTSLKNIKYSIFTITDKLIKNYPSETSTIDLSELNLQPNLYLLQCISGDKIFYKKIILE